MFVPAKLTVVGVFNQLRDIASMSGNAVSLGDSLLQKKVAGLFVIQFKRIIFNLSSQSRN